MSLRHLLFSVAIAALAALPCADARADPPARSNNSVTEDITIGSRFCGFPVQAYIEGQFTTLVFDPNGAGTARVFFGGPFNVALTNPATGEAVRVNASGPHRIEIASDGSITSIGPGPWLMLVHPETLEPGIWWLRGRIVTEREPDGTLISASFVGSAINLCGELAA